MQPLRQLLLARILPAAGLVALAVLIAPGAVSAQEPASNPTNSTTGTNQIGSGYAPSASPSQAVQAMPVNTATGSIPKLTTPGAADTVPMATTVSTTRTPTSTTVTTTTAGTGAYIPPPPPSSIQLNTTAASTNPNELAAQAETAALQAQAEAEAAQARREQEHNVKSFNRAEAGMLPLSTDQIRTYMHRLEQTQDAAQSPYDGPPKGQVRITTLSLDPGAEPPVIYLDPGYVTTINMLDASGAPWPILDVGAGGNFEVSPTPAGTHVIRLMPLTRVGMGNLSVILKDLSTPVIFRLSSGGGKVDMRFDARIPKYGPNGKPPIVEHEHLVAGDETLMMLLENVPPQSAQRLKVGGLDSRTMAWTLGDKTYIRTPLQLLSPSWNASVTSGDGMTVYEIGDAPVLLMSDNGAMVRARLSKDSE